jgi:hypothetical protein
MFDSLDDQMKHDAKAAKTPRERWFQYLAVAVLSVVFFAGVFFAVRLLE